MCDIKHQETMDIGKLIAFVGRMQAVRTDRYMERLGFYRGQAFLLLTLSRQDGMTHTEIAERLEISPAAATKVIKRMEALNYLRRRPDPSDERVSRVFLEEEGQAVIHKIFDVFKHMNGVLTQNLSEEEQVTLHSLLTRVYDNLLNLEIEPLESNTGSFGGS